ncbi:radical SAM protein [Thermoanaerobacterium sp. RBIITD]|uniref:radical SAM protein n=1 Tax=Thermoanaerobacterium sp. RBIITD TaxID=1550240 RepID=UPI000BB9A72C|nr:radical SAM protein [Thermoanaerobacterium sp. RBIITD]SNX53745.1 nitrogen fixation protein NifB [Thermoanaerobacterium sp. RBIITD]
MNKEFNIVDFGHPCFNPDVTKYHGRIHLPVAPKCNIKCKYCDRKTGCINENRPGVTTKVMNPYEALCYTKDILEKESCISVVGIAGPGDPLYNEETFMTFKLISLEFKDMIKCLSTNGLLLSDKLPLLIDCGISTLTVTINAIDPYIGKEIYDYAVYKNIVYKGIDAAKLLIEKQLEGIEAACDNGILVKINTVLIPGINDGHIKEIAQKVKELGIDIMNIMPLISQAELSHIKVPECKELEKVRMENSKIVNQMYHCRQCRADAVGLLGEDI